MNRDAKLRPLELQPLEDDDSKNGSKQHEEVGVRPEKNADTLVYTGVSRYSRRWVFLRGQLLGRRLSSA